ncbi:NYN domain-containing protein [Desarmillaria tabescens]|uniref:NYN domain-containing protein n=1 Tax=Armillaria tabescens TaxID=1929756 RepID=A0AA39KGN9_ARMTA|nr:NYN domain-containing protein [Desarmillaria tabescens]KAK0459536.1 NYN domain-containing protein [Desarmillaria tabescens]
MQVSDRVAIFWDFAPSGASGYDLASSIRNCVQQFGPIKLFKAYVDISEQSAGQRGTCLRSELQLSGVSMTDTPHMGKKNVADQMIIVDMLAYAFDNPQSSTTIVLITGDRDFAYAVAILRLRQFHVVVISPSVPSPHTSLTAHASMCIDWNKAIMQNIGLETPTSQTVPPDRTKTESPPTKVESPPTKAEPSPCPPNSAPAACPTQPVNSGTCNSSQPPQPKPPSVPANLPKPVPLETNNRSRSADPIRRTQTPDSIGSSTPAPTYTAHPPPVSPVPLQPPDQVPQSGVQGDSNNTYTPPQTPGVNHLSRAQPVRNLSMPVQFPSIAPGYIATSPTMAPPAVSGIAPVPSVLPSNSAPLYPPVQQPEAAPPASRKVVPVRFSSLVKLLEAHRRNGSPRPFRSVIAVELVQSDKAIYKKAGVEKFKQYVALAESEGIVELGGMEGGAWIGLRTD